jgi:hypothetical protein
MTWEGKTQIAVTDRPIRNRTQMKVAHKTKYRLKEYISSSLTVSYGVPQGSILGPLLFILYINYILHLTQDRTKMYADISILNVGRDVHSYM